MSKASRINIFGCTLRDITTQFGVNQNPSVWSLTLVRDDMIGQVFSLQSLPKWGIRQVERVQLGELDMYGLVQAWDEQKVNVAGTGVFSVRLTDLRPAMDSVDVFLECPQSVNLGENVVSVVPAAVDDTVSGVEYSRIKSAVENSVFTYGEVRFRLDLSGVQIEKRSIGGKNIPYRIRGSTMSLVGLVQQVADDHGFEWFVETQPDEDGVYRVTVRVLDRGVATLDMQGLADLHPDSTMKLAEGHENREEVTRTVVVGAQKQSLSQEPGYNWKPFWGFNESGDVLLLPTVRIIGNGIVRTRITTEEELERAINDEITDLPDDEIAALKAYADEYWGKQFYSSVSPFAIDANGDTWIDVTSGGWWETDANPDFISPFDMPEARTRFCTEDGRWTSFVRIRNPAELGATFDDSVLRSPNLWSIGFYQYYMKVSIERVDLFRTDTSISRNGSIFLLNLPIAMTVRTQRAAVVRDDNNKGLTSGGVTNKLTGVWINGYLVLGSNNLTGSHAPAGQLDNGVYVNGVKIPDSSVSYKTNDGPGIYINGVKVSDGKAFGTNPLSGSDGHIDNQSKTSTQDGEQTARRITRISRLHTVWMAVLDRRKTYGPWMSEDVIPESMRLPGKTRVIVDTSLCPWTFGYQGITNTLAIQNMTAVARARLQTYTYRFMEVDTGELQAAGLPEVNLGTEIGRATNVTNINVNYDVRGIITTYRCNLYTNELGRYQRYYQELIDKLRRDALKKQNTLYPLPNYDADLRNVNKGLPKNEPGTPANEGVTAKVMSRAEEHPHYMCEIQRQVVDLMGHVLTESGGSMLVSVTNTTEHPDAPGRIAIGGIVTIRKYVSQDVVSERAWVMEESIPVPNTITGLVRERAASIDDRPAYVVDFVEGEMGMLTSGEIANLSGVPNIAEPLGSLGYLRVGAKVTVSWVLNTKTQRYSPYMEQSLNIFVPPTV